jgi:hypothetical protein
MLLTYNRLEYAKRTLRSTLDNIHYDGGKLLLHVASDGDTDEYISTLCDIALDYLPPDNISASNSARAGYGANYNAATQVVHQRAQIVLPLEDDWELMRRLDLDQFVNAFSACGPNREIIGCIRMGYLGYTQELRGTFFKYGDLNWILLDPDSPEPHVFAGHPRLETVEWERKVGIWPLGLEPGATEFAVTHMPMARYGVVWPVDLIVPTLFAHIGTVRSW